MPPDQLSNETASLVAALGEMIERMAARRSISSPPPLDEETEPANLVAVDRSANPYAERIAAAMLKMITSKAQ
jgi:hypothetical protein